MKRIIKGILHFAELFSLIYVGIVVGSIPLDVALLALILVPVSKLKDDIRGNYIKDSMFSVTDKGFIHQNTFARPSRFIPLLFSKCKKDKFVEEAINMLVEIKRKDENGNIKKYHTVSQIFTLLLLKRLGKNGYIENLKYKEVGQSRLILEKIYLANFKELLKNKKHPMYYMEFNFTDKPRNKDELMTLIGLKKKDETNKQPTNLASLNDNKTDLSVSSNSMPNFSPTNNTPVEDHKKDTRQQLLDLKAELLAAKSLQPTEPSTKTNNTQRK